MLVPTNIPQQYLSAPVGTVLDLTSRDLDKATRHVRATIQRLQDTVQGRALATAPDQLICEHLAEDRSQIPATNDREGYWDDDHLMYWTFGLSDANYLSAVIERVLGREQAETATVIDWGCASGRVLRHLAIRRPTCRLIGTDINPNNIAFIRRYLPPAIIPVHNVVFPPLPLAEHSVDFLYALSVFTHISDFEEAWLCELKRILRPGGAAFVTVHTERTFAALKPGHFLWNMVLNGRHSATGPDYFVPMVDEQFLARGEFGARLVLTHLDWPVNNTNVFHHTDYIKSRWGQLFGIEEIIPCAHGSHQDGILLRP
jgi:SAM-dependent methyltransferase